MAADWENNSVTFENNTVQWVDIYAEIPPEMLLAIVDPYSGGAWLWLVEINITGYDPIRYAKNTEDIIYRGVLFTRNNFEVGLDALTGDGSIPRYGLVISQDSAYTLEDKINATEGACGGTVKIIRTHEDFLDCYIEELEQTVRILVANSDTKQITFVLGIPNPLMQKIPLRRYTSKKCPYAMPSLFKGPECQYAGVDATCLGRYEDCYDKSNQVHWGSELGLDPAAGRI